jgi:hypothetical protein
MKTRKKLLVASLGVAAVAYGCRRDPDPMPVGNLMPAPTRDAEPPSVGNLMPPPPPDAHVPEAGKDAKP